MNRTDHAGGPGSAGHDILTWLGECRDGGVRLVEREGTRFVGWPRVLADVERVMEHLRRSGLGHGTRVGVRGHNGYEWLVLDLALLGIGAVPVAFPVAEFKGRDTEHLTRVYGLSVVFADRRARRGGDDPAVALEDLLRLPPVAPASEPTVPEGERHPKNAREVFTLAFSSGTAGRVKCLLLAWEGVRALVEAQTAFHRIRRDDRILLVLPLSTFQQRYLCYTAIRNDCDIVLGTIDRFLRALTEARPTVMLGPPNFYEFAHRRYTGLPSGRRSLLDAAASLGRILLSPSWERWWRRTVFRSFHEAYGGSVRLMLVGSAPVPRAMLDFFGRAGFELYQIYGMTEIGYLTWNRRGGNRVGSVGTEVYPGTVSLGEDGEVRVRHHLHLCVGYEGEAPEEVAKTFVAEDTIATGDLGRFDGDGHLHLKGRKKNMVVTRGGEKIQLESLEEDLAKAGPVNRVTLFGPADDGRGLLAGVWYSGDHSEAQGSVVRRIRMINSRLGEQEGIRGLALIEGDLEPGNALLNRNLKVNRDAVRAHVLDRIRPLPEEKRER